MFTSRAEHRLLLRSDNADLRLSPYGYKLGLLSEEQLQKVKNKRNFINKELERIKKDADSKGQLLAQVLRQPRTRYPDIASTKGVEIGIQREIEVEIKYEGFIKRQLARKDQLLWERKIEIPSGFDYKEILALSNEAREKLSFYQPVSLDQASRISGLTGEDLSILLTYLKRNQEQM